MARKEYFLIDHDSTGEGFTPEEMEKYLKHFNLTGKPTGKSDEMGDEYDIEGSDEDLKNLDTDLEAMTGPDYILPWDRNRKRYFLIDHDSTGEGFTPEEMEKYLKHFNLTGKPTGKSDEMGDEYDIEGSDEDLKNLDTDLEAMTGPDYILPWDRDARASEILDKPHDTTLAGDLTPEEIEMIQMMRAGKRPPKSKGLAGETTPEENEMLNITNRLAKNLSKHRW